MEALYGEPVQSIIASFRRLATSRESPLREKKSGRPNLFRRFQSTLPHASQVGDTAVASISLASTSVLNNYVMPWVKTGHRCRLRGAGTGSATGNGLTSVPQTSPGRQQSLRPRANLHCLTNRTSASPTTPCPPIMVRFDRSCTRKCPKRWEPTSSAMEPGLRYHSPPAGFV